MPRHRHAVPLILLLILAAAAQAVPAHTEVAHSMASADISEPPSSVVTTTLDILDPDDGVVSLREAILYTIADPSLGPLITFDLPANTPRTIILTAPLPTLVGCTLTIDGDSSPVRIDGDNLYRPFRLESNSSLTLRNIVLAHGFASDGTGGALYCHSGQLTLHHCRLSGNRGGRGQRRRRHSPPRCPVRDGP